MNVKIYKIGIEFREFRELAFFPEALGSRASIPKRLLRT
jgi:hypothetical protein